MQLAALRVLSSESFCGHSAKLWPLVALCTMMPLAWGFKSRKNAWAAKPINFTYLGLFGALGLAWTASHRTDRHCNMVLPLEMQVARPGTCLLSHAPQLVWTGAPDAPLHAFKVRKRIRATWRPCTTPPA